jgi:hypothetical protein
MMSATEHYTSLIERSLHHFKTLSADDESMAAFTRSHNFIPDFELLREVIGARPEAKVLSLAIREYHLALYALAAANYRHAFISLRLFFELALSTIQFSASELKLRLWLANKADIVWSAVVHEESGVYATSFVSAFEPELAESAKQYSTLAQKVYRECSEHVHGNAHTHPEADAPIEFDKHLLFVWANLADTVRLCFIFAYAARFIRFISAEERNRLEAIFIESLGTLPGIQAAYQ